MTDWSFVPQHPWADDPCDVLTGLAPHEHPGVLAVLVEVLDELDEDGNQEQPAVDITPTVWDSCQP